MMRYLYLIVLVLAAGGCGMKTTPPVDEYTLRPHIQTTVTQSGQCREKTLKVLAPFASYEYTTNDLHYIVDDYEEGTYNQSSWSKAITSNVYYAVLSTTRNNDLFKNVENYTSIADSDLVLEMEITEFKQHYRKDLKHSYVVVDITFSLVDKKRYKIMEQKRFYKKLRTETLDAKGGVDALNEAFTQVMEEMLVWIGKVCNDK